MLYRPLSATNTKPSCINGETRVIEFNTEALSARTSRDFLTWIILIHTTTVASFTFTSQICGSIRRYHNRSCITIDAKRDALTFGIIYAFGPVTQEPIPPKWPEFDYRLREVLWRSRRETSSPFQVTNNYGTNGIHCRHAALIFKGEWHLRISFTKVLLWYHSWGASLIGWFSESSCACIQNLSMTCIHEVSHCQARNQRGILSYLSRWPQKEKRGESVSSSTTWHFQRIEPLISRKPKVPRAASTICLVLGESTWQLRLPSPFHFIFVQGTGCQSSDKFVSQWCKNSNFSTTTTND